MKKLIKILTMMMIFTSIITTTSTTTAMAQQPYKEIDYNYDIVSQKDWENTDTGEYPIDVDSPVWKQLSSSEAAAACDMPKEYAESLTTEELVDYVVNYPFLMDVLAYDKIADGINHLANKSSVFNELFSRADCYDNLIAKYSSIDVDYIKVAESNDVCVTNYDSELFIEEYIGLNYDSLSKDQAEKFVEEYGNKYLAKSNKNRESFFSTIFYNSIEEKLDMIPESAIPDNVAERLVDSHEANAIPYASFSCSLCGASLTSTTITINGKSVSGYQWVSGGYTTSDISTMDKYIANNYPTYTKVQSASGKYNCHSYAWYSTQTSNIYWIDDPSPVYNNTSYWTLWRIPMRNLQAGDRITFWNNSSLLHSAIVNSSTTCTSKLGHYGVYRTTISEMKSFYNTTTTSSYIPN